MQNSYTTSHLTPVNVHQSVPQAWHHHSSGSLWIQQKAVDGGHGRKRAGKSSRPAYAAQNETALGLINICLFIVQELNCKDCIFLNPDKITVKDSKIKDGSLLFSVQPMASKSGYLFDWPMTDKETHLNGHYFCTLKRFSFFFSLSYHWLPFPIIDM